MKRAACCVCSILACINPKWPEVHAVDTYRNAIFTIVWILNRNRPIVLNETTTNYLQSKNSKNRNIFILMQFKNFIDESDWKWGQNFHWIRRQYALKFTLNLQIQGFLVFYQNKHEIQIYRSVEELFWNSSLIFSAFDD